MSQLPTRERAAPADFSVKLTARVERVTTRIRRASLTKLPN